MKRKAAKRSFEEVSYKDICDKLIENINFGLGGKPVWDEKTLGGNVMLTKKKKNVVFSYAVYYIW